MAKDKKKADEKKAESGGTRGKKVFLPDGTARVDYIRDQYYQKGKTRSEIAKALSDLTGSKVPYQIVFAATKLKKEEFEKEQKAKKEAAAEKAKAEKAEKAKEKAA